MERKKFNEVTDFFHTVVSEEIGRRGGSYIWLDGVKGMVLSKKYIEVIYEDIGICERYFRGRSVLDFGTGSGYVAVLLASLGLDVSALDVYVRHDDSYKTETMTYDQERIWPVFSRKYPNLMFRHIRENRIPFSDGSFDAIVAYAVLEHIKEEELPLVMKEIWRVLKPGGHFFISRLPRRLAYIERITKLMGIGHHSKLFGDSEIDKVFTVNGFDILEKSFTDLIPTAPLCLTNKFFPLLKVCDKMLLHTPLKYFAHDIRIMSVKASAETVEGSS